ncbi:MAG: glycosyltransferase family 2 protein [Victivallaceae bacterium]|nr:glycosyltransferase family 2 protein [Victivallaceae bacterium]
MASLENCVSVIIPVYNEEDTIVAVVRRVLARTEVGEAIIVNDASTDGSWTKLGAFACNPRVRLFEQPRNMGKGAALIRGFSEARCPFVLVQDADFEYSPDEYPNLLAPLADGLADVVYGSRFMGTPGMVRFFRHEMGNKFLTFWSNVFSDINLSDMETCYKAFRREVIQNLNLSSLRFGIEVELTAKVAAARVLRIWQTPISYRPRRYDEGKKITWRDGIAAMWHIWKFNVLASKKNFYKRPWREILGDGEQ